MFNNLCFVGIVDALAGYTGEVEYRMGRSINQASMAMPGTIMFCLEEKPWV